MSHVDETGVPCARHPELAPARLYELALIGSRAAGFNHDIASKLQALMMAIDEANELAERTDPQLRAPLHAATTALAELRELLAGNRALTRPATRTRVSLPELVKTAAARANVLVRGTLDACDVRVAASAMVHLFSQLLDVAAGAGSGRAVDVSLEHGPSVVLSIAGSQPPRSAAVGELLALAGHAIERDEGLLACTSSGFTVRLPVATD